MRVVLDGVFNHTGYDSRYFNGRGRYDSRRRASVARTRPTARWYEFQRVAGPIRLLVGHLHPAAGAARRDAGAIQSYIIPTTRTASSAGWLRWAPPAGGSTSLDELPDDFYRRRLNAAAKQEKPDALVIGEVWEDASNKIAYSERRRYFAGRRAGLAS